jgi:site-specific recombinase XerD
VLEAGAKIPTLKEYKEEFLKTYAKANNKPSTIASKEGDFQRYLEPALGHFALDEIHPVDVERLKSALLENGLNPKTINNALGTLRKARRQLRHLKGDALVFCKPDGGRHIHRRADVALKRCCRRAKLREIGWHKLRHTFATHLLSRGRELFEVKELLGQRDINSTLVYAHLMPRTKREAVAVLDEPPSALRQHSGNE